MLTLLQAIDALKAKGAGSTEATWGLYSYILNLYRNGSWTLVEMHSGQVAHIHQLIPSTMTLTIAHIIPSTTDARWVVK